MFGIGSTPRLANARMDGYFNARIDGEDVRRLLSSIRLDGETRLTIELLHAQYSRDLDGLAKAWKTTQEFSAIASPWIVGDKQIEKQLVESYRIQLNVFDAEVDRLKRTFFDSVADAIPQAPDAVASFRRGVRRSQFFSRTRQITFPMDGVGADLIKVARDTDLLVDAEPEVLDLVKDFEMSLDSAIQEYESIAKSCQQVRQERFDDFLNVREHDDEGVRAEAAKSWVEFAALELTVLFRIREVNMRLARRAQSRMRDTEAGRVWYDKVASLMFGYVWNENNVEKTARAGLALKNLTEPQRSGLADTLEKFFAERDRQVDLINPLYERTVSPEAWKSLFLSQAHSLLKLTNVNNARESALEDFQAACERWSTIAEKYEQQALDTLTIEQRRQLNLREK